MNMYKLTPMLPALKGMYVLELHSSIIDGLVAARAMPATAELSIADAGRLLHWADEESPNPTGQKSAMARGIAELVIAGGGGRWTPLSVGARTFWEAVAQ